MFKYLVSAVFDADGLNEPTAMVLVVNAQSGSEAEEKALNHFVTTKGLSDDPDDHLDINEFVYINSCILEYLEEI